MVYLIAAQGIISSFGFKRKSDAINWIYIFIPINVDVTIQSTFKFLFFVIVK
jgi:hypothetical protein